MKYTIAGILSVIIMFGAVIFVFFGKKPVEESVQSSTKISESSTVSSTATTESSTEITSVSSDES